MHKRRVAILFGGKSAEHEVSIQSAYNIVEAMDSKKYEIILIYIDHSGNWYLCENFDLKENQVLDRDEISEYGQKLALMPGDNKDYLYNIEKNKIVDDIEVVFPVLHGPFGEDGTVQGLLKVIDIPFVGAGVLGSAVGMDKDIMKRLFRDGGLNIADYFVFRSIEEIDVDKIIRKLALPLFVKPANLGSSVGVKKVVKKAEIIGAIKNALKYDNKVIVEEFIDGRELECSVIGNNNPKASLAGEIMPKDDFYSYEAKYLDENGAVLAIPAEISEEELEKIQFNAIKAFELLDCKGMARVDFFLSQERLYVNEINTIPGFTRISMYPKLWEESGLAYDKVIDKLINLAFERYNLEKNLKNTYK